VPLLPRSPACAAATAIPGRALVPDGPRPASSAARRVFLRPRGAARLIVLASPARAAPAPRPRRPRRDACPCRPGSSRSSSRPPPRQGLVLGGRLDALPRPPPGPDLARRHRPRPASCPRAASASPSLGPRRPSPHPVRAAAPPHPRRRPGRALQQCCTAQAVLLHPALSSEQSKQTIDPCLIIHSPQLSLFTVSFYGKLSIRHS